MTASTRIPKAQGVDVPEHVRSGVTDILRAEGEVATATRLGVSRGALLRIAAGLPVRRGTVLCALAGLGLKA